MNSELKSASSATTGRSFPICAATAVPTSTGATDAASVLGLAAMIQTVQGTFSSA
jgi:hypothetical protein